MIFTSIHLSYLPYLHHLLRPQAVVIGSGIGGLYLAALLAKSGRVVVVLEQYLGMSGGCQGWKVVPLSDAHVG